jgi:hypothetical protein
MGFAAVISQAKVVHFGHISPKMMYSKHTLTVASRPVHPRIACVASRQTRTGTATRTGPKPGKARQQHVKWRHAVYAELSMPAMPNGKGFVISVGLRLPSTQCRRGVDNLLYS